MKSIAMPIALSAFAAAAAAQVPAPLAGRWVQSSVGRELVLKPKIKLTPYVAPGYGTNLGGSVGYGSATTTVIATEATPTQVEREMTLAIAADGEFTWTTVRRQAEAVGCINTVRQEKRGRAGVTGGELVLQVSGGTESFAKSCGGRGSNALPAATERYGLTRTANTITLASGPSRWTFRRN